MKNSALMKKIFGDNGERLPLIIGVLLTMIFVVYGFLPESVPMPIRHLLTVLLILAGALCVSAVWGFTNKQYYEYLQRREEVLFKKFEGINDMLDSLKRHATLSNKQSEQSNGSWTEATDKILQVFENRANEVKESISGQAGMIEEKIAEKMSGEINSLSGKVDALLTSEPAKGSDWSESVEKNLGDAFRSLEDKVANQLGVTARKLDEVIAAVAEHNNVLSAQQNDLGSNVQEWTNSENETSLREVLEKLEHIQNELKDIAARPTETGSDATVFEAMLSDRIEPILSNLEQERSLLQHLSDLVENDGKNTSSLLTDVSERLSADIAKGQSSHEEYYQTVKQQVEDLAKRLENNIPSTVVSHDQESISAFASQASELSKIMEVKGRQDAEQFDQIRKQMDIIERVLVEKVMDSTTSTTVESIAKMSAEVNRNIRELQNAGQGAENMFRAVSVELSGVRERLENLSAMVSEGDNSAVSAKVGEELGDSFQKIMLRLDSIEEQTMKEKSVSGAMSEEAGALLAERMDQLGSVVSGMQNEVTRLLLRVLVSQDDQSEQSQKKYDAMLSQMSGMMNDTKAQLDVLKHFVEDGHRALSENDRKSIQTAEEQLVQSAAMREKIEVYSTVSENYRKDMLMKLDYLQQQMQSLNLLAEVLKDVSMNSKLYNFRSDVR